jgi:hypothetical protein
MKEKLFILAISIISVLLLFNVTGAEEIASTNHEITISTGEKAISVKEIITLTGSSDENIELSSFWIQTGADDIGLFVKGTSVLYNKTSENIYQANLSTLDIEMDSQPKLELRYNIDKNSESFKKNLIRNTSSIKVVFDDITLYTASNLMIDTGFTLSLYKPTETPLSMYLIIGVILIVILLVVVTIYALKKPKSTKIKKSIGESEELLSTKKSLLMTILKDIEKQHRAKQISDDTYHKLKQHYKQEAVDAMKKLEDIGSKVK